MSNAGRVPVFIPARLASERLPAKALAEIGGEPLVVRAWQAALEADIGPVFVAAGGEEIAACIEERGGTALRTDPALPSGSDRVHAAAEMVAGQLEGPWLVNLQGDLPFFPPEALRRLAAALPAAGEEIDAVTLCAPVPAEAADDPALVKAAVSFPEHPHEGGEGGDDNGAAPLLRPAAYFSRAPVPWCGAGDAPLPLWGHIGVYAWRRASLARFVALPPSPLEQRERLEQLRAVEAGMRIAALPIDSMPPEVNTHAELERARRRAGAP